MLFAENDAAVVAFAGTVAASTVVGIWNFVNTPYFDIRHRITCNKVQLLVAPYVMRWRQLTKGVLTRISCASLIPIRSRQLCLQQLFYPKSSTVMGGLLKKLK